MWSLPGAATVRIAARAATGGRNGGSRISAPTASPAPGPGVPIAIVDSGTDPTHPEFAGRPNTTFLDTQTVAGREEYHGTIVASVAAAPANGAGLVGVYPDAALEIYDASSDLRGISASSAVAGILAAAQKCPAVINLSFGSTQPDDDACRARS